MASTIFFNLHSFLKLRQFHKPDPCEHSSLKKKKKTFCSSILRSPHGQFMYNFLTQSEFRLLCNLNIDVR